jgi:hypothetical protein
MVDKVQIKYKGMFLRLSTLFYQVHLCTLIAFLLLVEDFGEEMGFKGQS